MDIGVIFHIANLLILFYFVDGGFRNVGRNSIDPMMVRVICDVVGIDCYGIYISVKSYDY